MIIQLIIINVVVFVIINLVCLFFFLGNGGFVLELYSIILYFFCMFFDWKFFLMYFWGMFISMFFYEGFWYLFWNMLFLYWFGCIVGDFIGDQCILLFYLLGGLMGVVVFFIFVNFLFYGMGGCFVLGVFVGVMVIVVVVGIIFFDYIMWFLLFGDVKLKYIVVVLVFLDLILIFNGGNIGGYFVYFGGVFFGWFFVM